MSERHLFGSLVRYWVTSNAGELAALMFACGCHYSARASGKRTLRRRFCHRHRRVAL